MNRGPARILDFIERLSAIPATAEKRIWSVCLSELHHLKTAKWTPANSAIEQQGYKLTSLRSVVRDYRNTIRRTFGDSHPSLRFLRPSIDDQKTYKKAYRKQLDHDHTNLRPLDPQLLVDRAQAILTNADTMPVFAIAAALCLATGRRPYEVCCTGVLRRGSGRVSYLRRAKQHTIIFSGQAKTRGSPNARTTPYEIPTIVKSATVIRAFTIMRSRYDFASIKTDVQFNRYVGKEVLALSHLLFTDAKGASLTAKALRSAYAAIAYWRYRPETMSEYAFFTRILGHSESQTDVSLSYIDFYQYGNKRASVRDDKAAAREHLGVLELLRERETNRKVQVDLDARIDLLRSVLRYKAIPR